MLYAEALITEVTLPGVILISSAIAVTMATILDCRSMAKSGSLSLTSCDGRRLQVRIVTYIPRRCLLCHTVLLTLKATEVVKVERRLRLKFAGGEELV
jgi:hypothetical protein